MTHGTLEYLQVNEYYPNQDHIIKCLRLEGYDISIRTLRYWRMVGSLPPLYKMENQMCYPEKMVETIRDLCRDSGRYIGEVLFKKVLEGDVFYVFEVSVTKPDEKYQIAYKTDKGLLIERRGNLDGIYG